MRAITTTALLAALVAAGCAPRAIQLGPEHPANPEAPTGRLAGPPAALRPGVATPAPAEQPPEPEPPPTHEHDHGSHR